MELQFKNNYNTLVKDVPMGNTFMDGSILYMRVKKSGLDGLHAVEMGTGLLKTFTYNCVCDTTKKFKVLEV
jgi:hypothetical protein